MITGQRIATKDLGTAFVVKMVQFILGRRTSSLDFHLRLQ